MNLENKVITKEDIQKTIKVKGRLGKGISSLAMKALRLNSLNKMYDDAYDDDCATFVDKCLAIGNNKVYVPKADLDSIPKTGPLICLFNHPYGGLDALVIIKTILAVRPDMKFVANFMLSKIKPIAPYLLKVNPFESHRDAFSSTSGLKAMYNHLSEGKCLCIFPAGEVSTNYGNSKSVEDKDWPKSIIKFIYKAKAPIVSGYVSGENSKMFHKLGKLHPMLRTMRLPAELLNKRNKTVNIRFSGVMPLKTIRKIEDIETFGKLLKARTYLLSGDLAKKGGHHSKVEVDNSFMIPHVDNDLLKSEIKKIKKSDLLFTIDDYQCFFSEQKDIPNIFEEIARLREITFRRVGEGTGKEKDCDNYDTYYRHLFIWDNKEFKIVGAYRIGMGKDILHEHGAKGFYLSSLFNIDRQFEPYMEKSMEMGRSFITSEYQRRPLPLFLLWKGIYCVTQKFPHYKYLIGPASISDFYSDNAIALIIEYISRYHSMPEISSMIRNKIPFEYEVTNHMQALLQTVGDDLSAFDRMVRDLDITRSGMPVLLKKYISLGGKIVNFNVDPDFNNSIDGFVIVDIDNLSPEVLEAYG